MRHAPNLRPAALDLCINQQRYARGAVVYFAVDGEGRERVQQMEYGVSLSSAQEFGMLTGLELAAYLADASVDSDSVEAGKIYGVQMSGDFALTDTTYLTLGGGYEVLEWDSGEDDSAFTFSAAGIFGNTQPGVCIQAQGIRSRHIQR